MSTKLKIAVLGCGNMSQAVVNGIHRFNKEVDFLTYTPSMTRANELAQKVNGQASSSLSCVEQADFIIVACKPYQFEDLAKDLKQYNIKDKTIVSIMAAIPVSGIQELLGSQKVIRLMPSMPMNHDEGISLIFSDKSVMASELHQFTTLLKGASKVYEVPTEDNFDKLTVVTASGPALIYYFIDTFQEIQTAWGLESDLAKEIAVQLFSGATKATGESSATIKDEISKVTSNKGITAQALKNFEENKLKENIKEGIIAALVRSDEIVNEMRRHQS